MRSAANWTALEWKWRQLTIVYGILGLACDDISAVPNAEPGALRRKSPRKPVCWSAVAHFGATRTPCLVINISRHGAKLQVAARAEMSDFGLLITERFGTYEARLVWRKGSFAGIAFTDTHATSEVESHLRRVEDVHPKKFGRGNR
jgi:hypothetical protein